MPKHSGTFPIESERYVTLPLESHGYAARESIEHVLFEMITLFDTYVKNPARAGAPAAAARAR
ncbi:MAG: hypothetical protein DMG07_24985 [Acidobacteria bacterium]|nr:MAG: hypothetical protein DMG07_24985 [Acidobacteriota bacterium]